MDNHAKNATSFFETDHQDLQYIFAKIRKLNEINEKVLAIIAPELRKFCQVANVSDNKLILLTANSSIATELRFQAPDLLQKLRNDPALTHIKEIQTKVGIPKRLTVQTLPNEKSTHKVERLSPETAKLILDFAESLDDPMLKKAMENIARNIK